VTTSKRFYHRQPVLARKVSCCFSRGVGPGRLRLRVVLIYGIGFVEGGLFTDAPT